MGSSVGVSKARTADEFETCCRTAFRFDSKILIERCVAAVREIECSVLEDANADIRASQLGEIVPSGKHGFYSYDAKYIDGDGAALHVPANLPSALTDRIRELAIQTFRVLCCEGLARIDFFVSRRAGVRKRSEYASGIHQYQHVSKAVGGQRASSIRAHECVDPPRLDASPGDHDARLAARLE